VDYGSALQWGRGGRGVNRGWGRIRDGQGGGTGVASSKCQGRRYIFTRRRAASCCCLYSIILRRLFLQSVHPVYGAWSGRVS